MKANFFTYGLWVALLLGLASCQYLDKFINPQPPGNGHQKCLLSHYNNQLKLTYNASGRLASLSGTYAGTAITYVLRYDQAGKLSRLARTDSATVPTTGGDDKRIAYWNVTTDAAGNITALQPRSRSGAAIDLYNWDATYEQNRLSLYRTAARSSRNYLRYNAQGNVTLRYSTAAGTGDNFNVVAVTANETTQNPWQASGVPPLLVIWSKTWVSATGAEDWVAASRDNVKKTKAIPDAEAITMTGNIVNDEAALNAKLASIKAETVYTYTYNGKSQPTQVVVKTPDGKSQTNTYQYTCTSVK